MKVSTKTFWLPKRGNSDEEYEDAACPMESVECETDEFKCAVADGATEASFSNIWAKLLVKGYTDGMELPELAWKWGEEIKELELPWYAQEKAEAGAFATIACLNLKANGTTGGSYFAKAVGDSCIFHVRNEALIDSFPLSDAESFNSSPVLLCSNLEGKEDQNGLFIVKEGTWKDGDRFLLVTDAIANWTFRRLDSHGDALKSLLKIESQEELVALVNGARDQVHEDGRPYMRNDDVTLLAVEVSC